MEAPKTVALNNGTKMPAFGLGLYHMDNEEAIKLAVTDCGYRLYDCASFYKNEETIGRIITDLTKESKAIAREDLYVVSKCWWDEVTDVEAACRRQLEKLQVDYLDLYLVHWPVAVKQTLGEDGQPKFEKVPMPMHKVWAQFEALVDKGLVKSIGVSNFNLQLLWDLLNYARIKPVANEIELHPYNAQDDFVKFMKEEGIVPVAYCPIARGSDNSRCPDVTEEPIVKECAAKHGKTGAQILLRWGSQRGCVMIPKSNNLGRIKENIASLEFDLSEEEMAAITSLDRKHRICKKYPWTMNCDIFA